MTDEQLVAAANGGDDDAMDEILSRYRNYVKARARSFFLAGNETEDLVQEGMIGLYKAVRDYNAERGATFRSFAYLCIRRRIFTAIKGANREKHRILTDSVSLSVPQEDGDSAICFDIVDETATSNPEEAVISREKYETLRRSIASALTDGERKILQMYLAGMSYAEISAGLSVNSKYIDNSLQRIKKKLWKNLKTVI